MSYPALTHVMASGYESWYPAFEQKVRASGRFNLVKRTDNMYRYELPSLEPDTAKLLGHYSVTPNKLIYSPLDGMPENPPQVPPTWLNDIDSGYLPAHFLPRYHRSLQQLLIARQIQLQDTPQDGLCFFHAVAMQLGITESELRAALYNHLLLSQASIQAMFPQYAGDLFDQLLAELFQGSWGDTGQALLVAWIFNRRVILVYFYRQSGKINVQILNPDGSVIESTQLPADFNSQDIALIHNGLGHWLAGGGNVQGVNLQQHNAVLLGVTESLAPYAHWQQEDSLQNAYSPNIFPALIGLMITGWYTKNLNQSPQ